MRFSTKTTNPNTWRITTCYFFQKTIGENLTTSDYLYLYKFKRNLGKKSPKNGIMLHPRRDRALSLQIITPTQITIRLESIFSYKELGVFPSSYSPSFRVSTFYGTLGLAMNVCFYLLLVAYKILTFNLFIGTHHCLKIPLEP